MTIDTLFGPETIPAKIRTIRFKVIKPVYETLKVRDEVTVYLSPRQRYTSPEQIFETFKFLQNETKEYFLAIHLDGKNRAVAIDQVSIGSLNQSIVHPREVFKSCLLSSAASIILVHNHPTGSTDPSREDIEITKRLKEAGELIGIKILDHIIIGESYLSFTGQGLL
jgi:DNA repair protein RadC